MIKPIVFISHITEEKEMALALKDLIEKSFLGMIDVFVSSDENSIASGSRWLDNITKALKDCAVELILCSPKSVKRPWINFEAGAGWIRDINVIPLCHSGMEPSKLPIPLNLLQAVRISELSSLKLIFPVLAEAIGAKIPNVSFDEFIGEMKILEEKYTFWNEVNNCLSEFHKNYEQLFNESKKGNIKTKLEESEINELNEILKPLDQMDFISVERTGGASMYTDRLVYNVEIRTTEEYHKLFTNKECIFF